MSEDFSVKEKINSQIDVDKEILSVLPKNNKKNLKEYKFKAAEIKQNYTTYLDQILSEMKTGWNLGNSLKNKSFFR